MTHYHSQYNTLQGQYTHGIEIAFLQNAFRYLPVNSLIIDIGGGGGRISQFLSLLQMRVAVVDITFPPLGYINYKFSSGREYPVMISAGTNCELPFREGVFDAAVCIQVPDLVENGSSFFGMIYPYLKDDALLVVTITNKYSYKHVLRILSGRNMTSSKRKGNSQTVVYQFPVNQIIKRARDAGFSLLNCEGYNWIPFNKSSNARLIPHSIRIERQFGLYRFYSVSPWVIASFKKIGLAPASCRT